MQYQRQQTIDIYNQHAEAMAKKFRAQQARIKDIDAAFELIEHPEKASVVEIGCGDGRDAKEIVKRCKSYLGIDVAEKLIDLAREYVPDATFQVADAPKFEYPAGIDVVYAFASFIHLDKPEIQTVFDKLHDAMNTDGVIYLSLKWAPEFCVENLIDQFGERYYYFYNLDTITELAGDNFSVVKSWRVTLPKLNHAEWLEIILKKN